MAIEFIPLKDATDTLIHESISSVLDTLPDDSPVAERMWARVRAIREGDYPSACEILIKDWEGVGWSGWFPLWSNPYSSWSSATYLAPRLRGKGLLPILRCRQAHAAEEVLELLKDNDIEFVSSIDTVNTGSLKASHRYAKASGWRNRWSLTEDRENDRIMLRMVWPSPPNIPHHCYMGQDLNQFEETLMEPEVKFDVPQGEDELNLLVDTWVRARAQASILLPEAESKF